MAHIIPEKNKQLINDYTIYLILFSDERFFIGRAAANRLLKAYSEHCNLRVKKTKTEILKEQETGKFPPIYALDTGRISQQEAFQRIVAWTKFFLDLGYQQVVENTAASYATDLYPGTQKYYDLIREKRLEDILCPEGGLFPNYRKKAKDQKAKKKKGITIHLNDEEYKRIKSGAKAAGCSMSTYCKKMVINGRVLQPDLSYIREYLNTFSESKTLLRQIMQTIYLSQKYYPADLKNIQNCIERLKVIEERAYQKTTELIHHLRE